MYGERHGVACIGAGVMAAFAVAHRYDMCAECPASAAVRVKLVEPSVILGKDLSQILTSRTIELFQARPVEPGVILGKDPITDPEFMENMTRRYTENEEDKP